MNTRQSLAHDYAESLTSLAQPLAVLIHSMEQEGCVSAECMDAQYEHLTAILCERDRAVWASAGPGMTAREVQNSNAYLFDLNEVANAELVALYGTAA
ncbi:hypothetical protein H7698_14110 [Pseudomonas sp. p50]|uniref:hypothetical protein n=1 Tax=Pseudomonas sp. p50(2008) TaxID=2816832 RepID=UPI00188A73DF|nr:hypothetical protein [Pseudomonas sp. p50(2008)]MBF4557211.1 hypothetical protein [Pseudomonas sp. p50(2008)]